MLRELVEALLARRNYWLLPMAVIFGIVATLMLVAQTSILAPFIYTLF
jgi:hypothetical protein